MKLSVITINRNKAAGLFVEHCEVMVVLSLTLNHSCGAGEDFKYVFAGDCGQAV